MARKWRYRHLGDGANSSAKRELKANSSRNRRRMEREGLVVINSDTEFADEIVFPNANHECDNRWNYD